VSCNIFKSGNELEYRRAMVKRYGEERIAQYEILAKLTKKLTETDFNNVYDFYKMEYEKLLGEL
jgi:hypothetical protein